MEYLGVHVPSSKFSTSNKSSKSSKLEESKSELIRPQQYQSDSALSCTNNLVKQKRGSRSRHNLKYSKSLPACTNIYPKYFLKSKSEPSHSEETPKYKAKSKFCSNNVKDQCQNQFSILECGENMTEKLQRSPTSKLVSCLSSHGVPEDYKTIGTDLIQEKCDTLKETVLGHNPGTLSIRKSLHKISPIEFLLESRKFGQQTVQKTPSFTKSYCSCPTSQATLTDKACGRTSFYTAPNDYYDPLPCVGEEILKIRNVNQICDRVYVAHIPSIPLPPNKLTHLLINLPSEAIAACEPQLLHVKSSEIIELFAPGDHSSVGREIDIGISSESLLDRKSNQHLASSPSTSDNHFSPKLPTKEKVL